MGNQQMNPQTPGSTRNRARLSFPRLSPKSIEASPKTPKLMENGEQTIGCVPSIRMSLKRALPYRWQQCAWSCHPCDYAPFNIEQVPDSIILQALQYLPAAEVIYFEGLCSKVGGLIGKGGWCETLVFDELWRTGPGAESSVRKHWFPVMSGVKTVRHLSVPFVRSIDDNYSVPSTAPSIGSASAREGKNVRADWIDIQPSQLEPLLESSKDSLEELDIYYGGKFKEFRLLPLSKEITMEKLTKICIRMDCGDVDSIAVGSEDLVVAFKRLVLPNCTSLEIGVADNHSSAELRKMADQSSKATHGSSMKMLEAFGGMITSQNALAKLSLKMSEADAELLTEALPHILEV